MVVLQPSHTNLHTQNPTHISPVTCYEVKRETPSIRAAVLRVFLNREGIVGAPISGQ
ncbi:hypothetical protein Hdeb2414_s0015g00447601 [Helianthus debilis subsp. tardiflorus]